MKTKYQYMEFKQLPVHPHRKTSMWGCVGISGDSLGTVKWFGRWRQYCFYPEPETIFNRGCLADVDHFIMQLMDERKANPPKGKGRWPDVGK